MFQLKSRKHSWQQNPKQDHVDVESQNSKKKRNLAYGTLVILSRIPPTFTFACFGVALLFLISGSLLKDTDTKGTPTPAPALLIDTVIKKRDRIFTDKHAPNSGWTVVDWTNPFTQAEEAIFDCEFTPFQSASSKKEAFMCVHKSDDAVSNAICREKHFHHCDVLPEIWNSLTDHTNNNSIYIEIGANIGSCVMEMLLGTNASIIAFEPHPMNAFAIKKSISKLDIYYQNCMRLFPIGLGSNHEVNTIFGAEGNMGNSVIGKKISDPGRKQQNAACACFRNNYNLSGAGFFLAPTALAMAGIS